MKPIPRYPIEDYMKIVDEFNAEFSPPVTNVSLDDTFYQSIRQSPAKVQKIEELVSRIEALLYYDTRTNETDTLKDKIVTVQIFKLVIERGIRNLCYTAYDSICYTRLFPQNPDGKHSREDTLVNLAFQWDEFTAEDMWGEPQS